MFPHRLARTPSVASSWADRLERPTIPGALARPFGQAFAPFTSSPEDRLALSPAKGSAFRCIQGVFRLRELSSLSTTPPGEPSKDPVQREGGPLSTSCSHPVDKGPALFHLPRALL